MSTAATQRVTTATLRTSGTSRDRGSGTRSFYTPRTETASVTSSAARCKTYTRRWTSALVRGLKRLLPFVFVAQLKTIVLFFDGFLNSGVIEKYHLLSYILFYDISIQRTYNSADC